MNKKFERRAFAAQEFRVDTTGTVPKLRGHAAVFDQLSEDLGGFREKIAPGAFANSITQDDVRALFNHDANFVLGRNKSGTLRMVEDETGLQVEIDQPDTQLGRDIITSVARGDITQMSFGFTTIRDAWAKIENEWVRTLLEVKLYDVSPVTYPAYPQTDVAVRSLQALQQQEKEQQEFAQSQQNQLFRRRQRLALALRK